MSAIIYSIQTILFNVTIAYILYFYVCLMYNKAIYYEVSSPPASMYLSLLKQPSSVIDKFVQIEISGLLLNN